MNKTLMMIAASLGLGSALPIRPSEDMVDVQYPTLFRHNTNKQRSGGHRGKPGAPGDRLARMAKRGHLGIKGRKSPVEYYLQEQRLARIQREKK